MFRNRKSLLAVGAVLGASLVVPLSSGSAAATPPSGAYASTTFSVNWDGQSPVADPPFSGMNSTRARNSAQVLGWTAKSSYPSVDLVVTFPGVGGTGGIALASTDGGGLCTPTRWWHAGTAEKVAVHCDWANSWMFYSVAYTRQVAAGGSYAYAQASRPAQASYTPDPTYQYATSGKRMTVTRTEMGRYVVSIPSVATAGSTVAVGASGAKNAVCRVDTWTPATGKAVSTERVKVRCDAPWGAAVDSPFVIAYASSTSILGDKRLGSGWWIDANKPYSKDYVPPQSGLQPLTRVYQGSPGAYNVSGTFVDCTSQPARFASTPFILQGAGALTYVTPRGTTHNVCSLDNFF